MKCKLLILIGVIMILQLVNPVYADESTTTPDVSFVGWIWNGITNVWDYWFKGEVIESKTLVNNLGNAKVNVGWSIVKQEGNEANFDVIISNPLNKDTDICLVLKEGIDSRTVDLTAKPISTLSGQVTDKSVPLTLAYEPAKCVVDGRAVEGYKLVLSDPKLAVIDSYVKIGTNSLVLEYQNESKIQYDFDFGQTNITLLKNGIIDSNIYVYYNETEGKIDFGANDYSPTLKNYTYVLNSTEVLIDISLNKNNIILDENGTQIKVKRVSPYFYNYAYQGNWNENRQAYSFEGICNKNYSDCSWIVSNDKKSLSLKFKSYGDIATKSITNVSGCATLSIANEYYILNQSINTTGTCIDITADNITLDGNGYELDGDDSGEDYGIFINTNNVTITNITIKDFYIGVVSIGNNTNLNRITANSNTLNGIDTYLSLNSIFSNITANSNSLTGLSIDSSSNNTFSNITANSNTNGFLLYLSSNNILRNINVSSNNNSRPSTTTYGLYLFNSNNNDLSNVITNSNNATLSTTWGIKIETSSNNTFSNITANSNRGVSGYGIYSSSSSNNNTFSNITANSNSGIAGGGNGIYLESSSNNNLSSITANSNTKAFAGGNGIVLSSGSNNQLLNITTNLNSYGIYLTSSSNNNLSSITANSNTLYGIWISSSSNNKINNTNMWNCSNGDANSCIYVYISSSNSFENLYINSTTNSGRGIYILGDSAVATQNSSGNIFKNVLIENINGQDVNITRTNGNVTNNTFLNATYNLSKEGVSGNNAQLIRKWYYTAYVNDTLGNNLNNANITIYNITGTYQFNLTTGANGITTSSAEIIDYINNAGTRTFSSLYNNTAVKGLPNPTYALKNQTWNVTLQNNTRQVFTLTKTSAPNVTFNSQTPSDLNLTNFIGVGGVNITYNISDYDSFLNLSKVLLYYKSNSTASNVMYYQNGTSFIGYFPTSYIDNVSSTFRFNLKDNQVLEGTYNYGEVTLENTIHTANSLSNTNNYVSIELLNVTNTAYSFFEVMANSTNIIPVYYCNSSYAFSSSPTTNTNCNLVYNIPANNPYDHTHTNYSSHQVVPFTINEVTGTFGTVKITSRSYFILRGAGTTQFYSIANLSRAGAMRTSANSGNSWTNQTYTVDAHLHQFDSGSSLWYYACANDTLNNQNCSTPRQDVLQLTGLPPTAPQVYSPTATGYSGTIPINYTSSTPTSPNTISFYNISLMDSSNSYVKNIINNNLNLGYLWDSSTTTNGNYIIRVTACDNTGQCSSGYSEIFTLSNFAQQQLYVMPEEKYFLTTQNANVTIRCRMSNGSDCPVQTDCRITSYYPNRTILADNLFMLNSAPIYSYNFGVLTTTGAYNSIVFCYNYVNGTASFNFDINKREITTGGYGSYGYDNPRLPHLV